MAQLIALLAWVAPSEAKEYYDKLDTQVSRMLEADHERTKWKQHPLYSNNTKEELEKICRTMKHRVSPPCNITISNSHNLFESLIKHLQ